MATTRKKPATRKPSKNGRPATLGALRKSGYAVTSVRDELRNNLMERLRNGEPVFPGIVGYEETVIPQVENAILAGQDIILLGERGQAKSRMIRALVELLDDEVPIVRGSEVNDDPLAPISRYAIELIEEQGDDTPIDWIGRDRRYGEKLATPDISIADLVGDVDPIRIAEGRYLSDELAIHYGLIPRTNRGIFCINELPDLAERIQVGLFNLMEERDVQIKGYLVRLSLDVLVVASANPEDYTNRGRIITPLKDRYGAQIRTHYPREIAQEISIMDVERNEFPGAAEPIVVPEYIKELIAEFTALARRHPEINQRSGVSVRVSIANYETVSANALRRAISQGEEQAVPRITDFAFIISSTLGKVELETMEEGREAKIVDELIKRALLNVFDRHFEPHELDELVMAFEAGQTFDTGADLPSSIYLEEMGQLEGFAGALSKLGAGSSGPEAASAAEFVLEGLHLNRRLNRDQLGGGYRYRV
ncbi:MAG: magnesium chelatase [Chloroflexota bacterium]|nr:magnesium chelatase [Chloroflexota bacterium]MDE2884624.1 magnesium chelatase [Chloroflexota bacterium]